MFTGSLVALVTPMKPDGAIDYDAMGRLIEMHIDQGTQGLVVNGSTGESPTLSPEERLKNVQFVLEVVNRRLPVIAGTGTNNTASSILQTQQTAALGVDACLVVTPYYNRPTQQGLYQHFKSIADAVSVPIILYNVPTRTSCDLHPDTTVELSKHSNIVALKEAALDLTRVPRLRAETPSTFKLLTGNDHSALDFMLAGGDGVISVTGNVMPQKMRALCDAVLKKDVARAQSIQAALLPLHEALSLEANPIPVKWALQHLGRISSGIRLPLTTLSEQFHEEVQRTLCLDEV